MTGAVSGAGHGSGAAENASHAAIAAAIDRAEELPVPPDDAALARELLNDLGNARRLIARHGSDLVYVEEWGWGAWDGARWRFDDGEARAAIRAHETAEAIFDEAEALPRFEDREPRTPETPRKRAAGDDLKDWEAWERWDRRRRRHAATQEQLREFALASGNTGKSSSMLGAAAPYLRRAHDHFDAEVFALNVSNGTLRLDGPRVGLFPPRRGDLSTKCGTVAYDAEARCPKWRAFVAEVFPDAPDTARMVQAWLGYCLTGSLAEQKAVILEGQGANGKSTLMNVVAELLGDYVQTVPVETFLHQERGKSGSGPSPDIARMVGARLVRTSEPEPGSRLSESTLKQYTGGERMVARKLHKDFFEFTPRGKLTMSVNVRPVIVGKDHGIKRRLLVVPFPRVFTRAEIEARNAVRPLHDDLMAEGPGILNWLIEGFHLWREGGLEPPAAVTRATEAYFAEMDPIGQFIREACELPSDATGVTETSLEKAADLFAAYKRWCDAVNEEPRTQTAFGRRLNDLGVKSEKRGGIGFRAGVRLRQDWAPRGPMTEE
jgi:putative DNA primase/helicase